jgi:hypothetical protein
VRIFRSIRINRPTRCDSACGGSRSDNHGYLLTSQLGCEGLAIDRCGRPPSGIRSQRSRTQRTHYSAVPLERRQIYRICARRRAVQIANHRQWLLRAQWERPRSRAGCTRKAHIIRPFKSSGVAPDSRARTFHISTKGAKKVPLGTYSYNLPPTPSSSCAQRPQRRASSRARMSGAMLFGCEPKLAHRRGGLAVCGATSEPRCTRRPPARLRPRRAKQ